MEGIALQAFVTLFVVIDPPGCAVIYAVLSRGDPPARRRSQAIRGTLVAALILIAFAVGGEWLFSLLGIGLSAFRIAGGILLMLVAINMVFAQRSHVRQPTKDEESEAIQRDDISVFPLAFPLIAGPGAMTSVVLLGGLGNGGVTVLGIVLATLAVVLAVTLACLLAAARLADMLGVTGVNVLDRIFGVILAALAAQFVLDGIKGSFGLG
ncbi:MAG: MarC family protein [Alphaproteobacteria bacterium]|nr:MarC family protein [Alphaproteobacteria bacterium]